MKHLLSQIVILISSSLLLFSQAQNEDPNIIFQKFNNQYRRGDFIIAEKTLKVLLNSREDLPEKYKIAAYINLGAINSLLSRYEIALNYNDNAENLMQGKEANSIELATLYLNKAFIFSVQKSYDLAIEYLEKSVRIYNNLNSTNDSRHYQNLSAAYLNIGIVYYETKNYKEALEFFNKSVKLKTEKELTGLGLAYLNIAKTIEKIGDHKKAEKYYLKSISTLKDNYGNDYYRLIDVYFDYGIFLVSVGRDSEAMKIHRQALYICLNNYGDKHTFVSLAYKHIGDDFMSRNNCDSALYYYQRSLIAVVNNYNNTNIFTNPSIDSAIFDIRLLENLKAKAEAFEVMAGQQDNDELRLKVLKGSVGTMDLALKLIDRIRNNYPTEESRIYLAENEKETYFFALHIVHSLYNLTKDQSYIIMMYGIAQKAKASVLRNEINQNELFYSSVIPDSLMKKRNSLSSNISAYNNLIQSELIKKEPDNKMIALWKDDIFEMNQEFMKNEQFITQKYPEYHELIDRTEPVDIAQIRKHLGSDENMIDFFLSNNYNKGSRSLYMFLITKDKLDFREENLDSLFSVNANIIRKWPEIQQQSTATKEEFKSYTESLFEMYTHLVKPFKEEFSGNRLIIIPDEEIAWLPFDAFLSEKPASGLSDYEGLKYLLYDYSISYRYISSLIVRKSYKLSGNDKIYAFAPDYNDNGASPDHTERLRGAENEIESIMKRLNGRKFTGRSATVSDFREIMQNQAVLHLAMHSLSDSTNSRFSYLMFEPDSINPDGRLYNYAISLSRIKSPMVVLSACNSGTGTLYHGEGLMSLARGFILAGASSVIRTSWDVNDETSAEIISDFYLYLSKGKTKDEALRLAKMNYIRANPPVYKNPYYWAAYEVMGDNSPLMPNRVMSILLILLIIIAIAAGCWFTIYLRRRNTFSARSL